MSVAITAVESTDLFTGTEESPRQILRVTVEAPQDVRVTVEGSGVRGEAMGSGSGPVEVPLTLTGAPAPGTALAVVVRAGSASASAEVVVAEPGWTMFMVSHFHYDPVWWNTQASYTTPWEPLTEDGSTRPPFEWNSFALIDAHLDLALRDPDYKFVLAEIDYLKPYFDTHPERRADLRRLMDQGRVELIGGTYNEPNTNLTGAEATIRNIVYGVGYQRDILGGEPRSAWQLDVFGHDPQFPGYLDAAGLTGSAWARGPFHQWGPIQKNFREAKDDATLMQFDSEFEWLAPSGRGVLTHYMPHHYSAGWWMDSSPDLPAAEAAVYELYRKLKPVAATRNLLLPVGTDYTPPNKWVTAIHRSWSAKYVWPRFVCGTPHEFLSAVREELTAAGRRPSPQTRDMNPVYTGKDVSYIDTKQAQRAGEVAAVDAEKLATVAALQGLGRYPDAALDKVWRQLAYGAHHDAITGSESDQVYIDLLSGWREAHDLAAGVRDTALAALTGRIDTRGEGLALVVTNTLSFARSGLVSVPLPEGFDGGGRVVDDGGSVVPSAVERGVLHFLACDVPSLGWRTWRLVAGEADAMWGAAEGDRAENGRFRVTADALRGGALASVYDKASGRELIQGGAVGNELRVYEEYPQHPDFGEGPWHLLPKGPAVAGSAAAPGTVRRETGPLGERLVVSGSVDGMRYEQTVTLWSGVGRVDCVTRVLDFAGADRLVRLRFPVDVPGGLPVSEVAGAVIGRGFALLDEDVAEAPWTLDNPANTWFGLGSTARVALTAPDGSVLGERALGVAEIVVPAGHDGFEARDLVVAMARVGVTATTSSADRSRYGWLDVDSNLPDFRVVVGGPEDNDVAREILERAGAGHSAAFAAHGRVWVPAEKPLHEVWQPMADLRDLRALPALVVADPSALAEDFADARVAAVCAGVLPESEALADRTAALLTYGLPGFAVDSSGALHLSLMRSCTGWPSGVWIDPPRRTLPDGAAFQLQHWTHEFAYALVAGDGDWRTLSLPAQGQEFNHPVYARVEQPHDGPLPPTHCWLSVSPPREVLLGTVKPTGNPIAHGRSEGSDPARGVTLRLMESTGFGRQASVEGALGLGELREADLLERTGAGPASLSLAGSEVATVTGRAGAGAVADGDLDASPLLGAHAEIAQPVYARYWLHNRGPAPLGYLPVSVAVSPGFATTSGEPVELSVALASHLTDTAVEGTAEVVVPEGWRAEVRRRPYRLGPSGHVRFPVALTPPADAEPGTYFATVRIEAGGQMIEDVATVRMGDTQAEGLEVAVEAASIRVRAGGRASLAVVLTNRTRDEIRGEVQVVSPWGTWQLLAEPVQGVTVAAGATYTATFEIATPSDAAPGAYWALAKVMWFGRCQYAPTVELVVEA